jgi:hypothetical protein
MNAVWQEVQIVLSLLLPASDNLRVKGAGKFLGEPGYGLMNFTCYG